MRGRRQRRPYEAEEAYLRSPTGVYAQAILDADALSRMAVLGLHTLQPASTLLGRIIAWSLEAMSYAAASDYILYTRTAKKMAQTYKPHTLAAAKWLSEEMAELGFTLIPRTETSTAGLVAYLDLQRCPCGRAAKEARVKPLRHCIEYHLAYTCCGERIEASICTPESTRLR